MSSPHQPNQLSFLFPGDAERRSEQKVDLAPGVVLLVGFARGVGTALRAAVDDVERMAPPEHPLTPGGLRMSAQMTSCGEWGWVSDAFGYRYSRVALSSREAWPQMPAVICNLAKEAAAQSGFYGFAPDSCLINRYLPGARMGLHQDINEQDFSAPIVSVSLGLSAIFLLGGVERQARPLRVVLEHGDVLVWGGPARLRYHGVLPIKVGVHSLFGSSRVNLTVRRPDRGVCLRPESSRTR